MANEHQKYIFHMSHDFIDLRQAELNSLCELNNVPDCFRKSTYCDDSALFTCELPSKEIARKLSERSVLLKSISDLYYKADTLENLLVQLKAESHLPCEILSKDTIKIDFYSFGKSYVEKEKLSIIEEINDAIDFKDVKVCLNNKLVKHRFVYFEDWIHIKGKETEFENVSADLPLNLNIENLPNVRKYLRGVYFGKYLYEGKSNIVPKFNLRDRAFISNTSMDPLLALVMGNMGHADKHNLIIDPFVGSGSLCVGAAYYGSYVLGADLDYNLINARGLSSREGQKYRKKTETIRNNLKQYGLENYFIDILVADFSSKYIRDDIKFDAIITDPPYGIREKAKKCGPKKSKLNKTVNSSSSDLNESSTVLEEKVEINNNTESAVDDVNPPPGYITQKTRYLLSDIFHDLLSYAVEHLVENGRLVYWLPIYTEMNRNKMSAEEVKENLRNFIPINKNLHLAYFSEQRLTLFTSRLLITMVKPTAEKKILDSNDNLIAMNKQQTIDSLNNFRDNYFSISNKTKQSL